MFAPCSSTVVKSVQSKTNATVAVTIKVDVFRETHELVVVPKVVVGPKGSNMICPFWFVRSTEHVQLANVIMAPHVVKVGEVAVAVYAMQTKKIAKEGQEFLMHRAQAPR